jgi:hypothetical protein
MYGRKMRNSYVMDRNSTSARARVKALIEATGCPLDDQGRFVKEALIGYRFRAEVILSQFNDMDENGVAIPREATKWVGESPIAGTPASTPAPQQTAPAAGGVRRPTPPNGGVQQARR